MHAPGGTLTSVRVGIRIVQLERHPLDEVAEIIRTSNNIRVRCRRSAAHGDRPAVGVVGTRERLPLLRGQDDRSVSIDYRTVYRHTLACRHQRNSTGLCRRVDALGRGRGRWRP